MTNWEKWKEELTPEEFIEMLQRDWDTTNSEEFLEWAYSEVKENEE